MATYVSKLAEVHPRAVLGENVSIGPFCVVGPEVTLGARVVLKSHAVVTGWTEIGDETVIFSWIVWPSKAARDAGMKKSMEDPRLDMKANPMPFDGQRLIYGGFEVLLSA